MAMTQEFDVVIIGAGLAGLSLARQLLLETDLRVAVVDKRVRLFEEEHKLGESTVQVAGLYFRQLDLEEHLISDHLMKYNLRMYWKNSGRSNLSFEDYSQSYIRNFSNIATYQIDRPVLEKELLRRNCNSSNFTLFLGLSIDSVDLNKDGVPNELIFCFPNEHNINKIISKWTIDASGRTRLLARKLDLKKSSPIKHGSAFFWLDGRVDLEKLTKRSPREVRKDPSRRETGHLPIWMATNHLMGEGFWVWLIPLCNPKRTSVGLVYSMESVEPKSVSTPEKLKNWIGNQFPILKQEFDSRNVLNYGAFKNYSYGIKQAFSYSGWAITGEAAQFTDPLYSPGCDFIALHNVLIVDLIKTTNSRARKRKAWLFELLTQSMYESFLPSYSSSYESLGDQETFLCKYSWELTIYFSFFVFPFLNELLDDVKFVPILLARFSRLGPINHSIQAFINAYFKWKKESGIVSHEPTNFDFTDIEPLCRAEKSFYEITDDYDEAKRILEKLLNNIEELGTFIVAWIASRVTGNHDLMFNSDFISTFKLNELDFDSVIERANAQKSLDSSHEWSFDATIVEKLGTLSESTNQVGAIQ